MDQTKILICEDEALVALELQQRLESLGYKVTGIASSGHEACDLAGRDRPDVALMDIQLKGSLSGPEIAEKLSREFDIPSIYLTAHGDPETVELASLTNPLGYLIKPARDHELEYAIRFGLSQHRAQKDLKHTISKNRENLERAQIILNQMSSSLAREIRMRGLQELIGGIAHYFNNSLTAIFPPLEFLRDYGNLPPFEIRQVRQILRMCTLQKSFVQRLLWASGNASFQLSSHPLQEAVADAIKRAVPADKSNIKISQLMPRSRQVAFIDKEAVTHALANVIENAVEAIGDSGVISISLVESYEEIPERFNSAAQSGKYSIITVRDSGPGIPQENLSRIIEPFYTTRLKRIATGLGLSEAYGILQGHGGWLDIQSQPGAGTTVQLYIPQGKTKDIRSSDDDTREWQHQSETQITEGLKELSSAVSDLQRVRAGLIDNKPREFGLL